MWKARISVGIAVGLISCVSQSEILTLEGASYAEFLNGGSGSDAYPFNEIGLYDDVYFSFQFDTEAEMVPLVEGIGVYEFVGLDFFMQIGQLELSFDSIILQIGTHNGQGSIRFEAYHEALGIFTALTFGGTNPVSTDVPTSIDLAYFNWSSRFEMDTNENPGWPPLVSGPIYNANIVPAPGVLVAMLGPICISTRRRR